MKKISFVVFADLTSPPTDRASAPVTKAELLLRRAMLLSESVVFDQSHDGYYGQNASCFSVTIDDTPETKRLREEALELIVGTRRTIGYYFTLRREFGDYVLGGADYHACLGVAREQEPDEDEMYLPRQRGRYISSSSGARRLNPPPQGRTLGEW